MENSTRHTCSLLWDRKISYIWQPITATPVFSEFLLQVFFPQKDFLHKFPAGTSSSRSQQGRTVYLICIKRKGFPSCVLSTTHIFTGISVVCCLTTHAFCNSQELGLYALCGRMRGTPTIATIGNSIPWQTLLFWRTSLPQKFPYSLPPWPEEET